MDTDTRTWLFTDVVHANRGGLRQGLLLPASVDRLMELIELVRTSPGTDPRGTPGRGRCVGVEAWKRHAEPLAEWYPRSPAHAITRIVDLHRDVLPGQAIDVVRKLRPSCSWQYHTRDGDGPYHTENFSPVKLSFHLFGAARTADDLVTVFTFLADTQPHLLHNVLAPAPTLRTARALAARQAMNQRFPDGLPTEALSVLLGQSDRDLREIAITCLPASTPQVPHRVR